MMRYIIISIAILLSIILTYDQTLVGQDIEERDEISNAVREQQRILSEAKQRNKDSLARSNILRNRADNIGRKAERFVIEKEAINADINAARANLDAAKARMAIIANRQTIQQKLLAQQTSPILRLMGALENLTRRPTALMILQPQSLDDYVHVRAIMASVQPKITQQTAGLRGQVALQKSLRNQQKIALESLEKAQDELSRRQQSLARLEGNNRNQSGALNAEAAQEFERAIAAGERARDIVENIDDIQENQEFLATLSVLDGPKLKEGLDITPVSTQNKKAYVLPAFAQIISGFGELSSSGYRERGIRVSVPVSSSIRTPADGVINYAGRYRNFGHIVIIEHGGGWVTLITNMASLNVSKGDNVEQGDILGSAKSRDNNIGIELRRNDRPMDVLALVSG